MTQYLTTFKPLTVALVTNGGWNLYLFRQPLIRALRNRGCRILLLAPDDGWVDRIPETAYDQFIAMKHFRPYARFPHRDALFFGELYQQFRRLRPDIILSFTAKPNIYGSLAADLVGIPTIPTVTGLGHGFMQGAWLRWILQFGYFLAFRQKNRVLFHNRDDRRFFHQKGIINFKQSVVIPGSGVDVHHFAQAPLPDRQPFRITCVARMIETKGISDLIGALRILREEGIPVDCMLIGPLVPGHPQAIPVTDIQEWEKSGLATYHGHQLDVRPYLRACHLFVLPSHSEGMPRAVLEAMAVGRPVLTTTVPGCAESVDLSCGWRVPPRAPLRLAQIIRQAATMQPETLSRMGQAARQRVTRRFRDDQVTDQYLRAIAEICSPQIQPIHV